MLQRVTWPPNYFDVYERRRKAVVSWRKNPKILQAAHAAYAVNPADFISDLVDTFDPRNAAKGEMTRLPFVLFRRQRERRPARMTMRCTGLLGSVARPVHCLTSHLALLSQRQTIDHLGNDAPRPKSFRHEWFAEQLNVGHCLGERDHWRHGFTRCLRLAVAPARN